MPLLSNLKLSMQKMGNVRNCSAGGVETNEKKRSMISYCVIVGYRQKKNKEVWFRV